MKKIQKTKHLAPSTVNFVEYKRTSTFSAVGRSYCYITCPFCNTEVKAYIWSLSGCGKRCPGCGALHGSLGTMQDKKAAKK